MSAANVSTNHWHGHILTCVKRDILIRPSDLMEPSHVSLTRQSQLSSQPGDLRSTGHQLISAPSWTTSPVRTRLTAYLAALFGLSELVHRHFRFFLHFRSSLSFRLSSFFLVSRLLFGELILIHVGDVWIWESNRFSNSVWALRLIYVSCSPAVARVLVELMINTSVSQFGQYLRVTRCQDFWHSVLMSEIVFPPAQLPYSSFIYPLQVSCLPFLFHCTFFLSLGSETFD